MRRRCRKKRTVNSSGRWIAASAIVHRTTSSVAAVTTRETTLGGKVTGGLRSQSCSGMNADTRAHTTIIISITRDIRSSSSSCMDWQKMMPRGITTDTPVEFCCFFLVPLFAVWCFFCNPGARFTKYLTITPKLRSI